MSKTRVCHQKPNPYSHNCPPEFPIKYNLNRNIGKNTPCCREVRWDSEYKQMIKNQKQNQIDYKHFVEDEFQPGSRNVGFGAFGNQNVQIQENKLKDLKKRQNQALLTFENNTCNQLERLEQTFRSGAVGNDDQRQTIIRNFFAAKQWERNQLYTKLDQESAQILR